MNLLSINGLSNVFSMNRKSKKMLSFQRIRKVVRLLENWLFRAVSASEGDEDLGDGWGSNSYGSFSTRCLVL